MLLVTDCIINVIQLAAVICRFFLQRRRLQKLFLDAELNTLHTLQLSRTFFHKGNYHSQFSRPAFWCIVLFSPKGKEVKINLLHLSYPCWHHWSCLCQYEAFPSPLSSPVASELLLHRQKTSFNRIYTFLLCYCCTPLASYTHCSHWMCVSSLRSLSMSHWNPSWPVNFQCSHWMWSRSTVHEVGHIDLTRGYECELAFG